MTRARKSLVAVWRDAVRDSELGKMPKLLCFVLSTYMNLRGTAFPSQDTLAAGCSASDTGVRVATKTVVDAGFLEVEWSTGRSSHKYQAVLPATAKLLRRSEWETALSTAKESTSTAKQIAPNGEGASGESVESAESGARDARSPLTGAAPAPCEWCGAAPGFHAMDCETLGEAA